MWFADIFFHPISDLYICCVACLFCCVEAFQFNITTPCMFSLFLFVLPVLSYHTLWFLLGFVWFQVLNLNLNSFQVNFFKWCKLVAQVHSFAHWISSFRSTNYWRDYVLPIEYFQLPCQILVNHFCMGLYLGSLFCSINTYTCFYENTILFYYSFVI